MQIFVVYSCWEKGLTIVIEGDSCIAPLYAGLFRDNLNFMLIELTFNVGLGHMLYIM